MVDDCPEISLYFHIPFCSKKCDYCHFFVLPDQDRYKLQLMEGLEREWKLRAPLLQNKKVVSVYFGGGTPALIGPEAIARILSWIPRSEGAEVTLEANPENITPELMRAYRQAGVNRASIGLQALDDNLLQGLGRTHSAQKAVEAVKTSSEAGFDNISIDLMYDLPHQTKAHWESTLLQALKLPITHLSLYNLTIEPQTSFYKRRAQIQNAQPDENASLQMYLHAALAIPIAGLEQYEISAFAKPGYASRHNSGYWTARPFLGFGPSAFSYWEGRRFRNVAHLNKYSKSLGEGQFPVDFEEELDPDAKRRELLAVELRLLRGVHLPSFEKRHGPLTSMVHEVIDAQVKSGRLESRDGTIRLTRQGLLFYDAVAVELI